MAGLHYDVVIIGAGPAGVSAAKRAAELGADVLILEKEAELGVKPCGEGVLKGVLRELGIRPRREFIRNELKGAYIFGPKGAVLRVLADEIKYEKFRGRGGGYIVDKRAFLEHVLSGALEAGANAWFSSKAIAFKMEGGRPKAVVVKRGSDVVEVSCSLVIGCDGYWSITAKKLFGLGPQEVIPCLQYVLDGCSISEPDMARAYVGRRWAPLGYLWVFPRGPSSANVGLGVRGCAAKPYLEKFIRNDEELKNARVREAKAALVPIGGLREPLVVDGAMLCGDAAGQVVPITGEGIHPAMTAGFIAGEVAAKAIQEGDVSASRLREYEERFKERWGPVIEVGLLARKAFEVLPDDKIDRVLRLLDVEKGVMVIDGPDIGPFVLDLLSKDPDLCAEIFGSLVQEVVASAGC